MDVKILLVRLITLLFIENKIGDVSDVTLKLITDALAVATFKNGFLLPAGVDTINSLKQTLHWMLQLPVDERFDQEHILQRLRLNTETDDATYEALSDSITSRREPEQAKKFILQCQRDIREYLNQTKVENIIREASKKFIGPKDKIDWRHFIKELRENLKPYANMGSKVKNASVIDDFDMDNPETMANSMERRLIELSPEGVMTFGVQALNRMFGKAMGIRRGEFVTVGALQHKFKSGMTLLMMEGIALYNIPFMRNSDKKPLLLRISFENDASDDVYWLYKHLKENETGLLCDLTIVTHEEAVEYVRSRLMVNGYHIKMMRIDPSDFTYGDLFEQINEIESSGYEIHIIFIDYLNMMNKKGCEQGPAGTDVRDLFRRVRNYFSKKGIAVVTPHQLSTEAKELTRLGVEDFVKQINGKGYWDSCKRLDQEIDFELYIHIVESNNKSYLTMQRGKHRTIEITKPADLYSVLTFHPIGGIRNDINGLDLSSKYIGGNTMAEGGRAAWYN